MMLRSFLLSASFLAAASVWTAAHALPVLLNGGFETTSLTASGQVTTTNVTGWSTTGYSFCFFLGQPQRQEPPPPLMASSTFPGPWPQGPATVFPRRVRPAVISWLRTATSRSAPSRRPSPTCCQTLSIPYRSCGAPDSRRATPMRRPSSGRSALAARSTTQRSSTTLTWASPAGSTSHSRTPRRPRARCCPSWRREAHPGPRPSRCWTASIILIDESASWMTLVVAVASVIGVFTLQRRSSRLSCPTAVNGETAPTARKPRSKLRRRHRRSYAQGAAC